MISTLSPASKTSRRKADSTFDNICLKFAGPRKSSSLPVSKKFYADILERVIVTSLLLPESEKFTRQTMDLIDTYLRTHKIHLPSQPKEIQLIFAVILPEIDRALTRSERARERAEKRHKTAIENLPESRSDHPSESAKIHTSTTTFSASDSTPKTAPCPSSGHGKIAPVATLSSHQNSTPKSSPETSSERAKISTSATLSSHQNSTPKNSPEASSETTKISTSATLSSLKNSTPESAPISTKICPSRRSAINADEDMEATLHTQKSGADEELKSAENLPFGQASSAVGFPLHPALTRRERRRLANAEKRAGKLRVKPLGKA